MNRFRRALVVSLSALTAAVGITGLLVAAGPALAAPTPYIVGGVKAPSTRWEVQLEFTQGQGTYGCTGEQLNASWVLTARHCVDGTDSMTVYQSASTSKPGRAHAADKLYLPPRGDLGLVHLATPAPLPDYAPLQLTYTARSSGTATIMGFGLRANKARPSGLYSATVALTGRSTDAYDGRAQHVTGVTGSSNHGDSGGALVVKGKVVGVCSTGDSADPGSDVHAGSSYAILGQSKSWLQHTAGV